MPGRLMACTYRPRALLHCRYQRVLFPNQCGGASGSSSRPVVTVMVRPD